MLASYPIHSAMQSDDDGDLSSEGSLLHAANAKVCNAFGDCCLANADMCKFVAMSYLRYERCIDMQLSFIVAIVLSVRYTNLKQPYDDSQTIACLKEGACGRSYCVAE